MALHPSSCLGATSLPSDDAAWTSGTSTIPAQSRGCGASKPQGVPREAPRPGVPLLPSMGVPPSTWHCHGGSRSPALTEMLTQRDHP